MTLGQCSRVKSFISGFEVARPNRLTNTLSYRRPPSLIARRYFHLDSVLDCTKPWSWSEPCNFILYRPSKTFSRGNSLVSGRNLVTSCIEILDGAILEANIEQISQPLSCIMSSGCLKVVIDHVSYLSSSQEPILACCCSTLTLLLKKGIEDDLSQRRRSSRQASQNQEVSAPFNWLRRHKIVYWSRHLHFIDPRHCELSEWCTHTHFGLEIDSPTSQATWVWEFSEMKFRESVTRRFRRTIWEEVPPVWHRIFQVSYFWVNRGVGIDELFGSRLYPSPSLNGVSGVIWSQFARRWCQIPWDSRRMLRMVLLEQVGFQHNFLRCPSSSMYCAANQDRGESFLWGLRVLEGWLGTWDIPELLAVSGSRNSLSSLMEFTLSGSSWIGDKSWLTVDGFSLSSAQNVHHFSSVWLYPLTYSNFLVITLCIDNLLRDVLGRFCSSYSILQITYGFLFELDQPWFAWCSSIICNSSCWLVSCGAISEFLLS